MGQRGHNPVSETHLRRYFRNKAGETLQEIAQSDGVEEITVKDSIRAVEVHRNRHNAETLNESVVATVLDIMPAVKKSLHSQLTATVVVEDDKGKKKREPDYQTQKNAVAEVRGLIQTVQPKTPTVHATQVNVGQPGAPRLASGTYVGMEDRLKAIQTELDSKPSDPQKQLAQGPLRPVEDAEYEEAEAVASEA